MQNFKVNRMIAEEIVLEVGSEENEKIPVAKRIFCGLFQMIAILMMPFVQMLCFVGPLKFYEYFQGPFSWIYFAFIDPKFSRYIGAGVYFPLAIILYLFQVLLLTALVKWIVIGKYKPGKRQVCCKD